MRWTALPVAPLALLAAASVSVAQTGLELIDGRVLEGIAVERVGDGYELVLDGGARIVIPAELVREVRLIVEPPEPTASEELPPGESPTGPQGETSPEELPAPPRPSDPFEQLAAFGPQRPIVARSAIDPAWWPSSDWQQDLVENEFDPASFREPAVGYRWMPQESLDRAADWATSQSSRWSRPAIGSAWWPRDGFRGIDEGPESD